MVCVDPGGGVPLGQGRLGSVSLEMDHVAHGRQEVRVIDAESRQGDGAVRDASLRQV